MAILPQEVLNRYDMVSKTLQPPVFDVARYPTAATATSASASVKPESPDMSDVFNEIVYKMAQYYFSVFQAIFAKDNDSVRPSIADFLQLRDPLMRSRKLIFYYDELHELIDKKLFYVNRTADEFKERSKTSLLEHAYQRVLEDSKQTDKTKYQEKLNAIVNMTEVTRKQLQEEINGLEGHKNDMDSARKAAYLSHVFRLPWDTRVDTFWDVQYSR